ncbi:MAG: hypothetical protein FRX49_08803 [Trebouxia sp. A1-2]|nr:MAG: hypothetical protein FRX49_08803 [Trebouxia sp. A1-2]
MYGTPGRQLQHGISERQLHAASERIAEWLRHVTQLFPSTSPIASVMLARLCLPASSTCPDPPYSEDLLAKVVTVTKCLKNNKPPGGDGLADPAQQEPTFPKLVALIRDLHTHHSVVTCSKVDSAEVGTSVGFKPGCVLTPPLLSVCLDSVICQLIPQLQQLGVTFCYKIDGQLKHYKNPTEEVPLWALLNAADAVIMLQGDQLGAMFHCGY